MNGLYVQCFVGIALVIFLVFCSALSANSLRRRTLEYHEGKMVYKSHICVGNEHIRGQWVFNASIAKKSFICCGWENNEYLQRPECDQPADIEFYRGNFSGNNNGKITLSGGSGCNCDLNSYEVIKDREKYEWIPTYCSLIPWNATEFCHVLGNRSILIMGDSMSAQTASTLINMIRTGGGTCGTRIIYHRNNLIYSGRTRLATLEATIEYYKYPEFLIMSAGPHMHDLGDHYTILEQFEILLKHVRHDAAKVGKNFTVIWRSQTPGNYKFGPNYPMALPDIDPKNDPYTYRLLPVFDSIMYEATKELNVQWLDMSPTFIRSDAKADPMHFCLPGPIDLFSILLNHKFQTREIP